MIDPDDVTKFDRSVPALQEFLLFCVCAAGKKATTVAKGLEEFLKLAYKKTGMPTPFLAIRVLKSNGFNIARMLKQCGIGCHSYKARSFEELAFSGYDLKTCSVEQLCKIFGIKEKTSRFFVLHSRPKQRLACLDTHILAWLKQLGYDIPKNRPTGKKYLQIEKVFLRIADHLELEPAYLDLEVWKSYSRGLPYRMSKPILP